MLRPVTFLSAVIIGVSPAKATDLGGSGGAADRDRALHCMALAIAYEAGFEPVVGRQAVGEVILNRVRSPAYPKSVCGVVFQGSARRTGCQFTFTCDGALNRRLSPAVMDAAREVAALVLGGAFVPTVAGATHYHAAYVSPYWAPSLTRVGRIGAHIFYRSPASPVHAATYVATQEPAPGDLGRWALAADAVTASRQQAVERAGSGSPAGQAQFTLWGLAPARP